MLQFHTHFFSGNAKVPSPQAHSHLYTLLFARASSALCSAAEIGGPTSFTTYLQQSRGDRAKSRLNGAAYERATDTGKTRSIFVQLVLFTLTCAIIKIKRGFPQQSSTDKQRSCTAFSPSQENLKNPSQ